MFAMKRDSAFSNSKKCRIRSILLPTISNQKLKIELKNYEKINLKLAYSTFPECRFHA